MESTMNTFGNDPEDVSIWDLTTSRHANAPIRGPSALFFDMPALEDDAFIDNVLQTSVPSPMQPPLRNSRDLLEHQFQQDNGYPFYPALSESHDIRLSITKTSQEKQLPKTATRGLFCLGCFHHNTAVKSKSVQEQQATWKCFCSTKIQKMKTDGELPCFAW
jgi:hypothetical protein